MNKKILAIVIVGMFLITGLATASAVVINSETKSETNNADVGNIECYVRDKNAPPGPDIKGLPDIKLTLSTLDGTLKGKGVTNDMGKYIFENISYGSYLLTADGSPRYSNVTIPVSLKESVFYASFELTSKARSRSYLNLILLELFEHFPVLARLINIVAKV